MWGRSNSQHELDKAKSRQNKRRFNRTDQIAHGSNAPKKLTRIVKPWVGHDQLIVHFHKARIV